MPHDPRPAWFTQSSEHFEIYYPEGLESLAPRCAAICESEYARLKALFKFGVESTVHIVLADETDESNGSATSFPRPEIFLIVAPPDAATGIDELDDWMRYLVSHELTHVFHLDHTRGFPHFLQKVFGHIPLFPAFFQPPWVLEGLATWSETSDASRIGRGQSSYYRALMRLEVARGIKPIRQVNQPVATWPAGTTRYLYGVYFMRFLEATYGRDSIRKWVENYSNDWIPFFFNRNAKHSFHKNMSALWRDFEAWLKEDFGPEIEAIQRQGIHGAAVDPGTGAYGWGPMKGDYAVRNDGRSQPRLQRLEGVHWRDLAPVNSQRFSPGEGRILAEESDYVAQSRWSTDLYAVDLKSGCKMRLTHGLRVREAVDMKGGIVALASDAGQKRLLRLNADGSPKELLWQGSEGENPSNFAASPDGTRLLASLWRKERGWDLVEFDFEKKAWKDLVARPEQELAPAWSLDGDAVYFSADYGRLYNIWKLNLKDGSVTRISNVVGAAMNPNPRPGGLLDFSLLTPEGMLRGELSLADLPPQAPPEAPQAMAPAMPLVPVTVTTEAYSALPTLWPTWWLPLAAVEAGGSYFGFGTANEDVLERHQVSLIVLAGLAPVPDVFGGATYAYQRWLPQLNLGLSRYPSTEADCCNGPWHQKVSESWSAGLDVPWSGAWRSVDFSGTAAGRRAWDYYRGATSTPEAELKEALLQVRASYGAAKSFAKSIGPSGGLQANLSYSRINPGMDNEGSWINWGLARPTSIGGLNILELAIGGGSVQSGKYAFSLAQFAPALKPRAAFRPDFSLRGYESNLPALKGSDAAQAHLGWRFPIARIERGFMAPPLGIDSMFGRVFVESARTGASWQGDLGVKSSLTVELNSVLVLGYWASLTLSVGWAHGLDADGRNEIYVNLSGSNF